MKKLIFGLLAVATVCAALPAAAQVVVGENRHGNVVVRTGPSHHRHHRVRYVYYDRHHHRHYGWR